MEQQEIVKLIFKLKSKTLLPEEHQRLKELLSQRADLRILLEEMKLDLKDIDANINNLPDYPNKENMKLRFLKNIGNQREPQHKDKSNLIYLVVGLAASILIAGIFLWKPKQGHPRTELTWQTIDTKAGERVQFTLPDKSTIKLNGNSSFSYCIDQNQEVRLVKLRGEAFFDVSKDPEKPFIIISDDFTTKVVGTSFNIDSDIEKAVEVNSGIVQVYKLDEQKAESFLHLKKNEILSNLNQQAEDQVKLNKGFKAKLFNNKLAVQAFENGNWSNNELVFQNEMLKNVLLKANRYYGEGITASKDLLEERITITFKNRTISQVLTTLAELTNAKLNKNKDKVWELNDN